MLRVKRNKVKLTRAQDTEIDAIRRGQRHAYNFGVEVFLKDPTMSAYDCMKLYTKIRPDWSKTVSRKWLDSAIMEARRAADVSYGYGNGELKFRSRKRNGHVTVTNYGGRPEVRGDMLHLGICGTFHADGNVAVNILERGGGKYPTEVGIIFVRRELVPSSRDGE